jgi:uncharacterized membrane protein (DUF441 family)
MTWRATATVPDRIFAALPYLLPLFYAISFGRFVLAMFPQLAFVLAPLLLPIQLVYTIPFAGLIVFMGLYLLVVRNSNISYFIRYNTMQSLLIGVVIFLIQLIQPLLQGLAGLDLVIMTFYNVVFLGVLAVVIFSVVQSLRGIYPELPTISEAVKSQVF